MSSEALSWAFKARVKPASAKLTLIALCECANYQTGRIFPSIEHLCEITSQNRKTIIANIAKLIEGGWIVDTGERAGRTQQIKVYQACIETVPKTEQSQKRNSSAFTRKESQKRDTEPSREPSSKYNNKARKPDCVSEGVWSDFQSLRKAKKSPLTPTALKRIEGEAAKAGWSLEDALAECAARGWQGFNAQWVQEAKNDNRGNRNGSRQSGDGFIRALDRDIAQQSEGCGPRQSPGEMGPDGHRLALVDQRRNGTA